MKNLCCVISGKYRKFEKPKISCFLEKILLLSIICSKYKNKEEKLFKEEIKNLKIKSSLVYL